MGGTTRHTRLLLDREWFTAAGTPPTVTETVGANTGRAAAASASRQMVVLSDTVSDSTPLDTPSTTLPLARSGSAITLDSQGNTTFLRPHKRQ